MFESKSELLQSPKDLELLTIKDITAVSRCQGKPSEEKLLLQYWSAILLRVVKLNGISESSNNGQ